jgi:chemotaxis protein MotB
MRKKKVDHGEHDSSERWLLTYSDLITLLLGLFVILYAMSKVDAGKYAELVEALGGVFGKGKSSMMEGGAGVMSLPIPKMKSERDRIMEDIRGALKNQEKQKLISVSQNERGLTVHLMEELLFISGSADLKASSLSTLDTLAAVLKELPNNLRVEGHTDDVPIHTAAFPSNWHLSVARALNTAFYLIEKHKVNPEKISVVGYSEYRPLVPNISDETRIKNRRVDIVITVDATTSADSSRHVDTTFIQPLKETE